MLLIRKQNENHITAFIDIGLRSVMCYVRTVSVNTKCWDTYLPRSYEYKEIFFVDVSLEKRMENITRSPFQPFALAVHVLFVVIYQIDSCTADSK